MGLFTDIYNKVAKFFRSQDVADGGESKDVATNRLKLVLMQDRTNLTPKVLEQMRGELIDLLSKYLELDKDLLELNFEQEGDQVALMLAIPVIRAKDEDEIEAAMKLLDDADEVEITEEEEDENITEVMDDDEEEVEISAESEENNTDSAEEISITDEEKPIETSDDSSNVSKPKEISSSKKENKTEKEASTEEIAN